MQPQHDQDTTRSTVRMSAARQVISASTAQCDGLELTEIRSDNVQRVGQRSGLNCTKRTTMPTVVSTIGVGEAFVSGAACYTVKEV